ncbi:DUF4259 domain-containing protein [Brevibacterium sp. 50QC2O2]|jgi:hypothetical protein|uniref:DUF4259 domain-containing protein n=1 Tax=Brevibacterium TaxID=1696 RepID=UPI00211C6FC6|nr:MULTISPECIES: DUF4259 domain-containing protein [unclassified Brevibacterium]MCQ9368447.1 DUF4259 domain-containing protein [Brevibacterium sp. 91QC2O2]MCQ9385973.1 DUF4259 domain-containing protein [Brevibacterium sp. 68QC2CO]MCQ9387361.1 DUF4259 domain-containing protein [Brevibacterium sp. 50QC2O2]
MGAWGIGAFENDGALDLVGDMRSGHFSFDELGWAFEDEDYLEVDGGQIALALAGLAVAVKLRRPSPVPEFDLQAVAPLFTSESIGFIRNQVERTLAGAEGSELFELWEETDELDAWLQASRATLAELNEIGGI